MFASTQLYTVLPCFRLIRTLWVPIQPMFWPGLFRLDHIHGRIWRSNMKLLAHQLCSLAACQVFSGIDPLDLSYKLHRPHYGIICFCLQGHNLIDLPCVCLYVHPTWRCETSDQTHCNIFSSHFLHWPCSVPLQLAAGTIVSSRAKQTCDKLHLILLALGLVSKDIVLWSALSANSFDILL